MNKRMFFKAAVLWVVPALLAMGLFDGCQIFKVEEKRPVVLKISANPWIGYTPLFYLDHTEELKKLGFKLGMVHSLGESPSLMSSGLVDGFAATQYELLSYRDELADVVPVFTIDRSAGADKIHSNVSIQALRTTSQPIEVFMEIGSVNQDLFHAFVKKYGLEKKRFHFHNDPQNVITHLQFHPKERVIVVSYEPFSSRLEKKGIPVVADSRNLSTLIIDALFTHADLIEKRKGQFEKLKEAFWRAKKMIDTDPRKFYAAVKYYLDDQSYEKFLESLKGIEWLPEAKPAVKRYLQEQKIDTRYLL